MSEPKEKPKQAIKLFKIEVSKPTLGTYDPKEQPKPDKAEVTNKEK